MILVDFPIDGGRGLFVSTLLDGLVDDCGSDLLVDGGVMFPGLVAVVFPVQWISLVISTGLPISHGVHDAN